MLRKRPEMSSDGLARRRAAIVAGRGAARPLKPGIAAHRSPRAPAPAEFVDELAEGRRAAFNASHFDQLPNGHDLVGPLAK